MKHNTGASNMIARMWRGSTRPQDRDAYLAYLHESGCPGYRKVTGNRAVVALNRTIDSRSEFLVVSLWDSAQSIRNFAGDDPSRAVFYSRDDEFLIDRDLHVDHYDVLFLEGLKGR